MSNELVVQEERALTMSYDLFGDEQQFEFLQRQGKMWAESDLVPKDFKGNVANCTLAIAMAARMNTNPFAFMQSCYVVHGKPSTDAKFAIAQLNTSGKIKGNIRFDMSEDGKSCTAYAEGIDGHQHTSTIHYETAVKEGWAKNNPKWQSLTQQMLKYRSAMMLIRSDFPEVILGMHSRDEMIDVYGHEKSQVVSATVAPLEPPKRTRKKVRSAEVKPAEEKPKTKAAKKPKKEIMSQDAFLEEIKRRAADSDTPLAFDALAAYIDKNAPDPDSATLALDLVDLRKQALAELEQTE